MRKLFYALLCSLVLVHCPVLPAYGSTDAEDTAGLRRELEELRAQMERMQEFYDARIAELQGKVEALETVKAPVAPPAPDDVTPLPGMGRPALELPDISVIGNVIGNFSTDKSNPDRDKVYLEEVELALQGYVYPDIWANVIVAMERESDGDYEFDVEEGYLEFQSLPIPGLSALVGRKLIDFGKVNPVHTHHWNYVDRPAVLESYLGDHGLRGQGGNLSYLLPLPFFAQVDFGAWYVDVHSHGHGHHHDDLGMAGKTFSTRLWSAVPISAAQELELGFSGLRGYDADHRDRMHVGGLDLTYRFMGPGLQRLLYQSEVLLLNRDTHGSSFNRWGFYKHLNYRFNKYWDAGVRFDWLETPFREKETEHSISAMLTRHLTESTKLRLQHTYDMEHDEHTVYLQAVFGIGPHAHPLE